MNILEIVDKYLESPYLERSRHRSSSHYPSQASCLIKNEYDEDLIVGKCLRSVYWETGSIKKTNPMTARSIRITKVGKLVEQFEIERYKELGIWRGNNVKFFNEKYSISGEIDALIYNENTRSLLGIEIKTGYDYKFRKEVIGSSTRPGKPKPNNLLQTMLYIDYFKIPFKLVYIDRGNAARKEYDITLNNDGTPSINGKKLDNGISIPGCIARFKQLEEHVENATLPRRDFQLRYSQERVEFLYDSNRLNKTQKKEFEKSKKLDIGDWNCRYCLAPGTLIYTQSGNLAEIEQLNINDKILGYNSIVKITNKAKIPNTKKMLTIKGHGLLGAITTSDHQWLIASWEKQEHYYKNLAPTMKWIKACNIKNITTPHNLVMRVDKRIINKASSINKNRAWLLGLFTAEGCLTNYQNGTPYRVQFTLHPKEIELAQKIKTIVKKEFNVEYVNDKIYIDKRQEKERTSRQVIVHSVKLANFIRSHILGRKAIYKTLSKGIMTMSLDLQKEFIQAAWLGDGSLNNKGLWILSTSSRKLCLQYQMILWRLGIPASAQYASKPEERFGYQCHQGYRVVYQTNVDQHILKFMNIGNNQYILAPIHLINEAKNEEYVYDITVSEYSCFQTEGGLVHNCDYSDYCWKEQKK